MSTETPLAPAVPAADATSEATTRTSGRRRVLIADPDDRVLGLLRSAVEAAGFAAETVTTARALLDAARRMPTHLVALSLDVADMTTAGVIEKLHSVCAAPPVILLARHGADPRQQGALRQAASACLFKPVDAARFIGTCERVLRLSDQRLREGDWRAEPRRALNAEVAVDDGSPQPLPATLVNLSTRGFRIQLPEAVGVGRAVRITVRARDSEGILTFEGRLLWEKPLSEGTLAGGDLVRVGAEDARILDALLQPVG
jgi:DNA-binding response OmpR family regulator